MKEAEEMYVRALRGKEEVWGPTHTSTLDTVNDLGNLYSDQGRMKEAEEMYVRALRGKEEVWGPTHTSTLDTAYNLGLLYDGQKRSAEAREIYTRAAAGYAEVEGDHEADIRDIRGRLALLETEDSPLSAISAPVQHQGSSERARYPRTGSSGTTALGDEDYKPFIARIQHRLLGLVKKK
jgi:tetratricopeptide (TPR) repeat protein